MLVATQVYIPLTRGYRTLISPEDFDRISRRNWYANVGPNYVRAVRMSKRRMIYMHHEILMITSSDLRGQEVDHINGNSLDNRRENLRLTTHAENMANSINAGRSIGVTYNYRAKLWMCYLDIPGHKRQYLGYTKTKEEGLRRVQEARGC